MELIKRVLRPLILWLQALIAKPDVPLNNALPTDVAPTKVGNLVAGNLAAGNLAAGNLVIVTEVIDKKSDSNGDLESASSKNDTLADDPPESSSQSGDSPENDTVGPRATNALREGESAVRKTVTIAESDSRTDSVTEPVTESVDAPRANDSDLAIVSTKASAPEMASEQTADNELPEAGMDGRDPLAHSELVESEESVESIESAKTINTKEAGVDDESNEVGGSETQNELNNSGEFRGEDNSQDSSEVAAPEDSTRANNSGDSNDADDLEDSGDVKNFDATDNSEFKGESEQADESDESGSADGSEDDNDAGDNPVDGPDETDAVNGSDNSGSVNGPEDDSGAGEGSGDGPDDTDGVDELGESSESSESSESRESREPGENDELVESGEPPQPLRLLKIDDQQVTLLTLVESLLFVAETAAEPKQFADVLDVPLKDIEAALTQLTADYVERGSGLRVQERGGKYMLVSMPLAAQPIEDFLNLDLNSRLSSAALETLAIVAYRQPVTRIQVESVRGVDCGGVLRTLLQRDLIAEVGRLEAAGRPILYSVTDLFMQHFGLTTMDELPSLETTDADLLWAATLLDDEEDEDSEGAEASEGIVAEVENNESADHVDDEASAENAEAEDVDSADIQPTENEAVDNETSVITPDASKAESSEGMTNKEVESND